MKMILAALVSLTLVACNKSQPVQTKQAAIVQRAPALEDASQPPLGNAGTAKDVR